MENLMYILTISNGDKYAIPVMSIALNRARFFADKFNGEVGRSLEEDTLPKFKADYSEIAGWAKTKMSWKDVKNDMVRVYRSSESKPITAKEMEASWTSGAWKIE